MNHRSHAETDQRSGLLRMFDIYHRIIFLFGNALLIYGWSRIISVDSKANFISYLLLLILISLIYFAYAHYVNTSFITRPEARFYALIWLGVCGFFLLLSVWNRLFLAHIVDSGYTGDIFRGALQTFYAPYYGLPQKTSFSPVITAIACIGIYVALTRWLLTLDRPESVRYGVRILPIIYLIFVTLFAISDNSQRLFENTLAFAEFGTTGNLGQFDSLAAVWRDWIEKIPYLKGRTDHYPPGTLYLAMLERETQIAGLFKAVVIILATLCIPLTAVFCSILGYRPRATVLALVLLSASASMLVFPTTAFTPMTAFFTLAALVSVGLAVIRDTRYAIVGGIAIGIYSFISFTVAVSSLLIGIFIVSLVFMGGLSMKRAWWITVYLLMSVSALWGGIYAITEFNIIDCLIISIENNAADMTQNPFDHGLRYFLRAFGNLLAYTGYLGAVISVCAVLGAFHARKGGVILRALAISTITSLLIASFSTLFYLETERIWVFLTPPMAILAAWGIFSIVPRRNFPTVATVVVTAALTASIAQEFFMTHYIPTDEYIDVNEYRYVRELLRER